MSIIQVNPGDEEEFKKISSIFSPFHRDEEPEPILEWNGLPKDIASAKTVEKFYLRIKYLNDGDEEVGKDRYARETIESAAKRAITWTPKNAVSFFITTNEGESLAYCYRRSTGDWEILASSDQAMAEFLEMSKSTLGSTELGQALLRMREVDPTVPISLRDIIGFPFSDFTKMQEAGRSGRIEIRRFSFIQDRTILRLISKPASFFHTSSMLAAYLIPLSSPILAFAVSHWFWLGLIYFFVGVRITTNIWIGSILRAAYRSESAFCLLFYTSKIHVLDRATRSEYEWQMLTSSQAKD
jgi:hypothetical protein